MAKTEPTINNKSISDSLRICADWIKEHAAELVGDIRGVEKLTVTIDYEPFAIPSVFVTKDYLQPEAYVLTDADYMGIERERR